MKVTVRWTATFETIIEVPDDANQQDIHDAAADINLDGIEDTEYQSDTWEIESITPIKTNQ